MSSKSYQKAWKSAIDLLSRRSHSAAELSAKLKQRGFDPAEIEAAIKICQREKYIDDHATAEIWIRSYIRKGYGPYRIRQELKQKGLPPEALDGDMTKKPDAPDPQVTARIALRRKRHAFLREQNLKRRQEKMYRFLYNRGFSYDIIYRAIQSVDITLDD